MKFRIPLALKDASSRSSFRLTDCRRRPGMENLEGRWMLASDLDDQISEAIQLGAVTTRPSIVEGSISPDTDVDMYSVQVAAGQTIDFDIDTVENGPNGLGSYIRLFDFVGNQLAANNDGAAPGENAVGFDAYLRHTFDQAGTYFLGVSNANNVNYDPITGEGDTPGGPFAVGAYSLGVRALPADDDNTFFRATPLGDITNGVAVIDAEIDPDTDVDMYVFSAINNQTIDFDIDTPLNGEGGLGSYLRLFNAQGQEIAANDDGIAPGENVLGFDAYLRYTFENSGTYYIGVSNLNNITYDPVNGTGHIAGGPHSIGEYKLTVRTPPPAPIDLDDTLAQAISLGTISTVPTVRNGQIDPDVDVDMFRFVVHAGAIVDIDIDTPLNGPGGLGSYMRLFDNQGNELAANDDGLAPGEDRLGFDSYLRYRFDIAGTYYVGISNFNNRSYDPLTGEGDVSGGLHATGSYQVSVQVLPDDLDDAISRANFIGAVSAAEIRRTGRIDPDIDVDLYSFNVNAGQIVDFNIDTVENGPGGLGSYLRLFNAAGQELAANDDAQAPGEDSLGFDAYLRYTFSEAGTYYIGVSNSTNIAYNPVTGQGDIAGGSHSIGDYTLILLAPGTTTDEPRLTLELSSAAIPANNGTALATVTRVDSDATVPLVINVSSSDSNVATVPSSVTIAAGQMSAQFVISGVATSTPGTRDVTISVSSQGFISQSRTLQVFHQSAGGHNPELPEDVNGDTIVTPIDLLLIINHLNQTGGGTAPAEGPPFLDVSGDGFVSPIDALLVIHRLNVSAAEGESQAALDVETEEAMKKRVRSQWHKSVDHVMSANLIG